MIRVSHVAGDRLRIAVREHVLFADQPLEGGGEDTAPTPTELFVAALGACIAFYAERYLRRHGIATDGLAVSCDYGWAEKPHRVGEITITVDAPGLPSERREAFQRVIEHCTLHSTLEVPPAIRLILAEAGVAA
jgi:putative redox protein